MFTKITPAVFVFLCLSLLGLCWFGACKDQTTIDPSAWQDPLEGLPDAGPLRFDEPAIGQRSRFVFFEARADSNNLSPKYQYSPDTLVMAFTGKAGDNWIVSEFLTEGSLSRTHPELGYLKPDPDTVYSTYLQTTSDSILFTKKSGHFEYSYALANAGLRLPKALTDAPATQNDDCQPFLGYSTYVWLEYALNYQRNGHNFDHLNLHFDYHEMAFDGFGYCFVYAPKYGFVRAAWVSAWTPDLARGWDLLPE